jgi:hypothetical protein
VRTSAMGSGPVCLILLRRRPTPRRTFRSARTPNARASNANLGSHCWRLLRAHPYQVRLWYYQFVNVIVLAQSILDLGPGCCAFSLGGLHQQLRYLQQQVPDVLQGYRERRESPLDRRFSA